MKQLLATLSLCSVLVPGLLSCAKDYKDKNSNAYKILGGWRPQKYTIKYTDFNGQAIVYERTTFDQDIWEFNKKKQLYMYFGKEIVASYNYSINGTELKVGNANYTITRLDESNLNYILTSPPNDTARVNGEPVGIVQEQEWQFKK